MSAIDQGRFTVASGAVGLAQACLDASIKYAHERKTFGQEIGQHQLVKQMIAKMAPGHRGRSAAMPPGGVAQESRHAQHARDVDGQVVLHGSRSPVRARRDPDARRVRLLGRVPGRALPAQLEGRGHLRGHAQLHTLIQADYLLGYREDKPLRCPPLPAPGFDRG